jgi:hypothetical protein
MRPADQAETERKRPSVLAASQRERKCGAVMSSGLRFMGNALGGLPLSSRQP